MKEAIFAWIEPLVYSVDPVLVLEPLPDAWQKFGQAFLGPEKSNQIIVILHRKSRIVHFFLAKIITCFSLWIVSVIMKPKDPGSIIGKIKSFFRNSYQKIYGMHLSVNEGSTEKI